MKTSYRIIEDKIKNGDYVSYDEMYCTIISKMSSMSSRGVITKKEATSQINKAAALNEKDLIKNFEKIMKGTI